ncbi:MAG: helix-turn-helix transcriptional regulator [Candidatus Lokiarchaeota archaeon]|nr:helix-turn-helix transcriptional regulator [Candidatus Lokiarchaeota archaeon]
MWLGKFLDLENDLEEFKRSIEKGLFEAIKKNKLTPLEFTIIESIFNNNEISGYDLIKSLDDHFAGTWKAHSGTVYPILSKLKKNGFLKIKDVKSPIGPIKKVYSLTKAGEELLKKKVKDNFSQQLEFIENFLVELASIYINSFPEEKKPEKINHVKHLMENLFTNVNEKFPFVNIAINDCPKCGNPIERREATFCSFCGDKLLK